MVNDMVNIWLMIWLMMVNLISGWWLLLTPLKNDGVSNSWDDDIPKIWQCVKTNSTPGEHQNSWYCKWMFIPLKMVLIGIDPYPYIGIISSKSGNFGNWKGTLSTQTVAYIQPPQ